MSEWQTFGGVDWIVDDGELVIEPSFSPESGYDSGELPFGQIESWPWTERPDIVSAVIEDGVFASGSLTGLFYKCSSLEEVDLSGLDTSQVYQMSYMFSECQSLSSFDCSTLDFSNVNNTVFMFRNCSSLTSLDTSGSDMDELFHTGCMFMKCSSLSELDLSGFNVSNIDSMSRIFDGCRSLSAVFFKDADDFIEACRIGAFWSAFSEVNRDFSLSLDLEFVLALLGYYGSNSLAEDPSLVANSLIANVPFEILESLIDEYVSAHSDDTDPYYDLEALYAGVPYEDVFA